MKTKKNRFFRKELISVLVMFFLFSCKDDKNIESLKIIIKQTLGTKLVIPKKMDIYKPFTNYKLDSLGLQKSEYKIYSFLNASCGSCVRKIKYWTTFSNELSLYNIPIILIIRSDDNFELLKYLINSKELKKFPYPFIFDKKDELMKLNHFMKESDDFKTILTDKNNKILLMGNPIANEKIKELYLKEIKKRVENK